MPHLPVASSVEDVHAHPRHTGHRWFDVTLALLALFISGVSLYVAIEHGRTERDLVAAGSWPFPQSLLNDHYQGRDDIAIGVINAGTGPAKIHSFQMFLDGRPLASPIDLLVRCCGAPADPAAFHRALPSGMLSMSEIDDSVLRPGDDNPVFVLHRRADNAELASRLDAALTHLTFAVCYCSVLDECWQSNLRRLETTPVKACAAPAHPYRFADRPN